jgi:hypothetical protein
MNYELSGNELKHNYKLIKSELKRNKKLDTNLLQLMLCVNIQINEPHDISICDIINLVEPTSHITKK